MATKKLNPTKRFSTPKIINSRNLERVPENKPGVYRIQSSAKEILYIGKAKGGRLDERIAEHKGRFQGGTKFSFRVARDKDAAERLERREIKEHIPPRNKKK